MEEYLPIARFFFRAGFASIFLVNAVVALLEPSTFTDMVQGNILGQYIPESLFPMMAGFIFLNDLVLGILIIFNRWKIAVYGWAGVWLLIIAGIKITNLIWPI